jgi:hypothetical protein
MPSKIRPSQKHLDAARYYLYGPEGIKGRWNAAAKSAGYERTPSMDTDIMELAFEEVRAEHMRREGPTQDQVVKELEQLLSGAFSWEEAAPIAQRVLVQIGAGLVPASAGQVSALKEMVSRAEGRVGDRATGDRPVGVVVLPALVDQDSLPYVDATELEDSPGDSYDA